MHCAIAENNEFDNQAKTRDIKSNGKGRDTAS